MRSGILTILLVPAALCLVPPAVSAQDDAGCMKADCHADLGAKKWVHGPVGAGICTVCHNPVENKDHEFVLAAEKEELCFACHEAKRDMMLEENVHTPVAQGNCVGCHDPHTSDFRFTLKGEAADLCFNCHDKAAFSKNTVHGPVAAGDCNACHNPHASPNEKQLVSPQEKLCYRCHEEKKGIPQKRHPHKPVAEKCTNCHSPHSNDVAFLLPQSMPDLCFGCHADIAEHKNASHPHAPFQAGECTDCHEIHGSDFPKLFTVAPTELCFQCHDEMQEFVESKKYPHGPVKDGDCNACHDPHGSENHRILRKYFPEEFYTSFAPEKYAICFECHNEQIVQDAATTTLTDFRDGDRNLHYLHVHKKVKGRSCRACHQVHASNQEKHIRESVPFGTINWELPVKYTKTENGGSCRVGCHAPKEYRR